MKLQKMAFRAVLNLAFVAKVLIKVMSFHLPQLIYHDLKFGDEYEVNEEAFQSQKIHFLVPQR